MTDHPLSSLLVASPRLLHSNVSTRSCSGAIGWRRDLKLMRFICALQWGEFDCRLAAAICKKASSFPRATIPTRTFPDFPFSILHLNRLGSVLLHFFPRVVLVRQRRTIPFVSFAGSTWSMYLWCFDLVSYVCGLILLAPAVWREIAIVVQLVVIVVLLCKIMEKLALSGAMV